MINSDMQTTKMATEGQKRKVIQRQGEEGQSRIILNTPSQQVYETQNTGARETEEHSHGEKKRKMVLPTERGKKNDAASSPSYEQSSKEV